jgi:hypothetical protein
MRTGLVPLAVTGGSYARYSDDRSSVLTFLVLFAIAVTAAYVWFRKR